MDDKDGKKRLITMQTKVRELAKCIATLLPPEDLAQFYKHKKN